MLSPAKCLEVMAAFATTSAAAALPTTLTAMRSFGVPEAVRAYWERAVALGRQTAAISTGTPCFGRPSLTATNANPAPGCQSQGRYFTRLASHSMA